jgi:hypothetical protein
MVIAVGLESKQGRLLTYKSSPGGDGIAIQIDGSQKSEDRSRKTEENWIVGILSHPDAAVPDCGAVHSDF